MLISLDLLPYPGACLPKSENWLDLLLGLKRKPPPNVEPLLKGTNLAALSAFCGWFALELQESQLVNL